MYPYIKSSYCFTVKYYVRIKRHMIKKLVLTFICFCIVSVQAYAINCEVKCGHELSRLAKIVKKKQHKAQNKHSCCHSKKEKSNKDKECNHNESDLCYHESSSDYQVELNSYVISNFKHFTFNPITSMDINLIQNQLSINRVNYQYFNYKEHLNIIIIKNQFLI